MTKKSKLLFTTSAILLVIFIVFTLLTVFVDKNPIGPEGSSIGLSSINKAVFGAFGTSELWYNITEVLGVLALAIAGGFAIFGLYQLIKRKGLFKVDADILLLACIYAAVAVFYVLFEILELNFRPVLVDGVLEASYPSSHTMLFCTIVATAPIILKRRFGEKKCLMTVIDISAAVLCTVMAVGRLLSGMHWFTDVVASIILSAFLVALYLSVLSVIDS